MNSNLERFNYNVIVANMYETYNQLVSMRELGAFKKGHSIRDEIIDWIDNGFAENLPIADQVIRRNKIFNDAIGEYVKDEARILTILDIRKRLDSTNIEIEALQNK